MTCIIGGKCSDGVVLIADRKSIDMDTGIVDFEGDKLFIFQKDFFFYPVVIGSAGKTALDKKFNKDALEALRQMNPVSPAYHYKAFNPIAFDATVSGMIYPYSGMSENNKGKEVILSPYISELVLIA